MEIERIKQMQPRLAKKIALGILLGIILIAGAALLRYGNRNSVPSDRHGAESSITLDQTDESSDVPAYAIEIDGSDDALDDERKLASSRSVRSVFIIRHSDPCRILDSVKDNAALKSVTISNCPLSNSLFMHLARFDELGDLHFYLTDLRALDLSQLQQLDSLHSIGFVECGIVDNAMLQLQRCSSIESLGVRGGQISDTGVSNIAGISNLKRIGFTELSIQQCDMSCFQKLKRLKSVDLVHVQIDEPTFMSIANIGNLESLSLYSTEVPPSVVAKLRESLPACTIHIR